MFAGFALERVDVGEVTLRVRHEGSGPPWSSSMTVVCATGGVHGDPVAIWRARVDGPLTAGTIDSGHHQAEEAPAELAGALLDFLA